MSQPRDLFLHALIFFVMLWSPAVAKALEVNAIRLGQNGEQMRIVLDLDRASDYRSFVLDNPRRLVLDIPRFDWSEGQFSSVKSAQISALRLGNMSPQVTRLVFDLQDPMIIDHAFSLPRTTGKDHRLVIDLRPVSAQDFTRATNKVFGTLNPAAQQSTAQTNNTIVLPAPGAQKPQIAETSPIKPQVTTARQDPPPAPRRNTKPLIVLDAGHGGQDPGAIGPQQQREKDIVLNLAKDVRDLLIASGKYRVKLTRDRDVYIRLRDRVKIARDVDADLFLSLHADSLPRSNVRGASFYTLSETASDKETAALAARENRSDIIAGVDLTDEDDQVASILMDLMMRDTMNQSKFLANSLVETFRGQGIRLLENPHRYAGFAVLKAPDVPSVLVEAGFISNTSDAKLLARRDHRKRIAKARKAARER